jgi:hypothetical protein
VAVLALAGCSHIAVFAQPPAIANHATELRSAGHAQVEVEQGGTVAVSVDDVVNITIPGDEGSHLWGLVKIGTPVGWRRSAPERWSPAAAPTGPVATASRPARGPIRVGTQRRLDPGLLGIGLFGALGAVVARPAWRSAATAAAGRTSAPRSATS